MSVNFSNDCLLNSDTITSFKHRIIRSTALTTNNSYNKDYYFVRDKMQDRWEGAATIKHFALKKHHHYWCVSFIYIKSVTLTLIIFLIKRNQVHLSRQLLSKGASHTAFLTAITSIYSQIKFNLPPHETSSCLSFHQYQYPNSASSSMQTST